MCVRGEEQNMSIRDVFKVIIFPALFQTYFTCVLNVSITGLSAYTMSATECPEITFKDNGDILQVIFNPIHLNHI